MYISTNVYITVQNRDVCFLLRGNLGTVSERFVSCKKGKKQKRQPESKALTVCWFEEKLKSSLTIQDQRLNTSALIFFTPLFVSQCVTLSVLYPPFSVRTHPSLQCSSVLSQV